MPYQATAQTALLEALSPATVDVHQASRWLGVSVATIRRLIIQRRLRILPGIRHKRITKKSIEDFLAGKDPRD
jgi:excisionase family DNA binding protein